MTLKGCNVCFSVVLSYAVVCKTTEAQNESYASPTPTRSDDWIRHLPFDLRQIVEETHMSTFVDKQSIHSEIYPPPSPRCRYIGGYIIKGRDKDLQLNRSRFIPLEVVRFYTDEVLDPDEFLTTRGPHYLAEENGNSVSIGFAPLKPFAISNMTLFRRRLKILNIPAENKTSVNIFEKVKQICQLGKLVKWGKLAPLKTYTTSTIRFSSTNAPHLFGFKRQHYTTNKIVKWNIRKFKAYNKPVSTQHALLSGTVTAVPNIRKLMSLTVINDVDFLTKTSTTYTTTTPSPQPPTTITVPATTSTNKGDKDKDMWVSPWYPVFKTTTPLPPNATNFPVEWYTVFDFDESEINKVDEVPQYLSFTFPSELRKRYLRSTEQPINFTPDLMYYETA